MRAALEPLPLKLIRHALTAMVVFDVSLYIFLSLAAGSGFYGIDGQNVSASTSNCYDDHGRPIHCEPPITSFSLDIIPEVDSVCGSPPAGFCFRHFDRQGEVISSNCSGVCDASDPRLSHPPEHMTDFVFGERTWWQSENSNTTQQAVRIEIALGTMVEVSAITFNFISPLPYTFTIWKSNNFGETYHPFHYFSSSCMATYGQDPNWVLTLDNETSVLCQNIPSLNTGQISFFPTLGRPSSNDSIPGYSEALYNFITATNIVVLLIQNFPINNRPMDDFGYYYAIEDLSIVGRCQCHGHASSCSRDPQTSMYQCDCEHNTNGTFCERCTDLFQGIPWQRANQSGHFECQGMCTKLKYYCCSESETSLNPLC